MLLKHVNILTTGTTPSRSVEIHTYLTIEKYKKYINRGSKTKTERQKELLDKKLKALTSFDLNQELS